MSWRWALSLSMLVSAVAGQQSLAQTPAVATVEVRSGRSWDGIIDARSSEQQLVLRVERGRMTLWRPVAWDEIQTASLNGVSTTRDELKRQIKTLATPAKSNAERAKPDPEISSPADSLPEQKPPLTTPKVISIACDALLANWDADVEADGLVIYLQPLDSWQQMVLVSGTLEVELYTLQARTFHHAPHSGGRSVEPIVRWSQAVNVTDYTFRGAQIRLPFQAAHPEFDDTLGAYGLVHIKFSAPGSGVFEQTIDGVRIRPWSPLRDYLQLDTGRRFLPHETTGRGKTAWQNDHP
jgi:hypothetical protein